MNRYIFTDCDLDGSGSYMTYSWLVGDSNIPYTVCRVNDLYTKVVAFCKAKKLDSYDEVLFFDLDVSDTKLRKLIDKPNVTIIDHHASNFDEANEPYTKANWLVQEATSTCKLIYKNYEGADKLTPEQKLFVYLVDDYDSYTLKRKESKQLNDVFWSYKGDRLQKLSRDFPSGFTGFNTFHNNMLILKQKDLAELKNTKEIYTGVVETNKNSYTVSSIMCDKHINDMADYIIETTKSDVGMVVNPKSSKVSFRKRSDDVSLSMVKLASILTDESGGHESASGGLICDKFLSFTKTLKPFTNG